MNEWKAVVRQLVARGYLDVDAEAYGALRLTESCRALLRGDEYIELRKYIAKTPSIKRRTQLDELDEADMPLWKALRDCRKQLAEQQGVPPYVVFHDATLREMVKQRPVSKRGLSQISGVGESKLARFGEAFLDVIRQYEYRE